MKGLGALHRVRRRQVLIGLGGVLTARTPARATRLHQLAILEGTSAEAARHYLAPFEAALRERGHHVNRDLRIVYRFADGNAGRYADLAQEIVLSDPDVIMTGSTTAALACAKLSNRVPIVSSNLTDPVGAGLISSLARPGTNVTGVTVSLDGLPAKILHLLSEVLPGPRKIGVLANANERASQRQLEEARRAAQELGLTFVVTDIGSAADFDRAFAELRQGGASAVYAPSSLLLRTEKRQFAEASLAARMPVFCNALEIAQAGALLSYGADLRENYRRAGYFVDRILRGAWPGDLPTENPTRFVCAINVGTARKLGVTVPPALFAFADEIIE